MKIEYGLTDAVYGFIFMTDAARQRCSKGSAAQSCSRAAAAVQTTCSGRHRVGARVFDLPSTSPSLHPTCAATETANPGERRQAGVYRKAATQPDSTRTALCTRQEAACERGGRGRCSRWYDEGEGVGEPKPTRPHILKLEYRLDRLLPKKLAQAYRLLVPEQRRPTHGAASQHVERMHEPTGSHLCSRLFRSPEGESHDRQSDRGVEGIRADTQLYGAAGMGVSRSRL